jgi:acetyl/propionyl-CoA carboxylase alpha subunit
LKKVLIANRGEIAVRVIRAVADLGLHSVAVYAQDDANSSHVHLADEAVALQASGPAAYLDMQAIIGAAQATGADAIHPGYGFLSERADFAQACADAGVTFVGPAPQQLAQFGDKAQAIALAWPAACPSCRPRAAMPRWRRSPRSSTPRAATALSSRPWAAAAAAACAW